MRIILVLLLVFVFSLVALFGTPMNALMAYLWYAFFRPQDWVWVDITSYGLSVLFAGLVVFRATLAGVPPRLLHRVSLLTVAFLLAGLLAQTNAVVPEVGWSWVDYFARMALICLYIVALADSPHKVYLVLLTITVSLGIHSATAGFGALLSGGAQIYSGIGGAFPDNNGFALASAMLVPLMLGLSQCVPEGWAFRVAVKQLLRVCAAGAVLTVIWTFSRGGLLALVTGLLIFITLQRGQRLKLLLIAMVVGVLAMALIDLPEGYSERVGSIVTYSETGEASALSRLHFWRVAIDMVRDHPFGVGMFNFPFAYDQYDFLNGLYGRSRPVHSAHFQVLAELGYLGFVVWMVQFAVCAWICIRVRREALAIADQNEGARSLLRLAPALLASMGAFFVGGAFGNLALNDLTWVTFAVIGAMDRAAANTFALQPDGSGSGAPRGTDAPTHRKDRIEAATRSG